MKVRSFIIGAAAALMTLVSCQEENVDLGAPRISLDKSEMTFEVAGGEQTLAVTATRDWYTEDVPEWVVVSPESGDASADPQTVTVTVLPNDKMDREADIVFSIGMSKKALTVKQAGPGGSVEQFIIYSNDFDKEEATKTYGSNGGSWPYLDQFEGWKNQTGTGAANVEYAFKGMSARANSTSDGTHSNYSGSGLNNMFFGANAYLATKNIALNGTTNIEMTFGTEKYSESNGSVFTNSEFHIWLSNDGTKWVELTDYTFAGGTTEGKWNIASATFTVPAGTANLSVCMQVDVASSYRMDDLKLVIASAAGTAVDFSKATEKDFGAGSGNGGGTVTPPSNIQDVTVAEFLAEPVSTEKWYRLSGKVGEGNINTTYGNFDIVDETGQVYVYGISNWADYKSKVAKGGTIVVVGQRGVYEQKDGTLKDEVLKGYIESYDGSTAGGGNEGGDNPPAGEPGEYDPQGITWTLGSGAYDGTIEGNTCQKGTVNGVPVNNLLKLGKGSDVGSATLHVPAGTKKAGAYIVAWKGTNATNLKFSVNGTEVHSMTPKANDGATGNPPYKITVTESDYYEIEVNADAAMDVKVETTDPAQGRVIIIGLKAIK